MLVVPGLGGSGPEHWQTAWERCFPRHVRVEQQDWEHPDLATWLAVFERAVAAAGEPVAVAAHSLGCALLVAPADVDSPAHMPPETRSFAPMPLARLPFPATVIASRDDPYVTLERARAFAAAWAATFVDAGARGHLNAASGLGDWPEGHAQLTALLTAR